MCNRHSSFNCLVPPYMMRQLMEKTSEKSTLFKTVVQNLVTDARLRSQRKVFHYLPEAGKKILTCAPLARATKKAAVNREVYTAGNKQTEPGKLVRKEGSKPGKDKDVNNVYDAAGYVWDFYNSLFRRNSIDNKGLKIVQTVHYKQKYDNAFWDGQQMVYGDGDGKIFGSFTTDIDVIGHELTHGVVQYECNLVYQDQSGALNESLADIFGIMIKQKVLNLDVEQSNWLIGENVVLGAKYALRSLKAPGTAYRNHPQLGTDPQPAHMSGYTNDPTDSGGVHLNSGIPNHAFYLACMTVGGFAWEKVGRVWYGAMCDKKNVATTASFADFKNATILQAQKLFKTDKSIEKAVTDAWTSVGV